MTIHAPNRTAKTLSKHLIEVWSGNIATTTLMISSLGKRGILPRP
jgi:hypothetical protein